MGLRILFINEVNVVAAYQFDIQLSRDLYQSLVSLLLQWEHLSVCSLLKVLYLMTLQFEVIVVAEDTLIPFSCFYRLFHAFSLHLFRRSYPPLSLATQQFGRHLAGDTCRADDESLMIFLQVIPVGARTHIESVNP